MVKKHWLKDNIETITLNKPAQTDYKNPSSTKSDKLGEQFETNISLLAEKMRLV